MKRIDDILIGKVLFVGIGNEMQGDDGAGPYFIKKAANSIKKYSFFNVKETPENYLNKIVSHNPDTVIFVDAVDFNSEAGTFKIFSIEEIVNSSISTHNTSLKMIVNFIKSYKKELKIFLIGIKPKTINFNQCLSIEVKNGIKKLLKIIKG